MLGPDEMPRQDRKVHTFRSSVYKAITHKHKTKSHGSDTDNARTDRAQLKRERKRNKLAQGPAYLVGRMAVCTSCWANAVPSSEKLAFFAYRDTETSDDYYCGCEGWD